MQETPKINCLRCQYYRVTWDRNFPKGCSLFGFKSQKLPCDFVYEASGVRCDHFMEKSKKQSGRSTRKA